MTLGEILNNQETLNISFMETKREIIAILNKPNIIKVMQMYGGLHLQK